MRPACAAGARSIVRQRIPMTLLLAAGAGPCGVATNDGDEMWSAGECKNEDMWPHPKSTVAMAEIATAARSDVPTGCLRDDKERARLDGSGALCPV
jgi:hypothetical protein